ncbi:transglycosylase family protein [Glutamicibacter sp. X7]
MIQQKTKKIVRRGSATLAAVAVAGGALVATTAPANAAGTWDALAQCESSGNWSINTGNGYYGGLQFSLSTWRAFGGSGMPHQASKAEQIRIATKVQASQGWGAWPACSAKLGLSGKPTGSVTPQETSVKKTAPTKQSTYKSTTKSVAPKSTAKKQTVQPKSVQRTTVKKSTGKRVAQAPQQKVYNVKVSDSGKDYTVKSGDTLFTISQKLGLDSWQALFVLNQDVVANADLIYVGQTLDIPAK